MKFYPGDRVKWPDGTHATVVPRPEGIPLNSLMVTVLTDGDTLTEAAMESSLTLVPSLRVLTHAADVIDLLEQLTGILA